MRPDPVALLLLLFWSEASIADPKFEAIDAPHHIYSGGWEHFVGGGIAAFDCNQDHLPELFVAGGAGQAKLLHNRSERGGAVSFVDDTPASLALTGVIGAYPLDINSDGYLDLVVLRAGNNFLLKGEPDCKFTPFDRLNFRSTEKWTTAFSATWEANQTLPTLAFGNYVDRANPDGPFRACDTSELYRPASRKYGLHISLSPGYCTLSMQFSDWGRQGRADLRVSNDRHYYVDAGQEQLWAMETVPRLYTKADGWQPYKLWGMGIASRDLTGDGLPEVFLTSMGDQRLQFLRPDEEGPAYQNVPFEFGVAAQRPFVGGDDRPSTGWHVSFGDVQNDGLDDIFVSKGNVDQMMDAAMDDPNNLLIQSQAGTFVEFAEVAGVADPERSRGAAMADFNLDGLLDLAVVNRRAPLKIYRNISSMAGNWLSVELSQPAPNRDAVGAWIEIDDGRGTQSREITVGGGHASGVAGPEHFGLGRAESVRLRVIWPDRGISDWFTVPANERLSITRTTAGPVLQFY